MSIAVHQTHSCTNLLEHCAWCSAVMLQFVACRTAATHNAPPHTVAVYLKPPTDASGDRSGGCVRALYNPTLSERGVLLCAARKPRAKDPLDFEVSLLIMNVTAGLSSLE